jgi:hypothetical protein
MARGIAKVIWPNEWLLVLLTTIAHHALSCIRFMDHPLLGRSALQLIENQFVMLLECAEAFFERIEQRLRHL